MASRNPDWEQHWRAVLWEWQESRLTVYLFCKRRNLSPTHFRYWQRKLCVVAPSSSRLSATFVMMTFVTESWVKIAVPGGVVLKLALTASAEQIVRWLTAAKDLGTLPC